MNPFPTTRLPSQARDSERGAALVVALLATMLLTAMGLALVLTSSSETLLTGNYRSGQEALYVADAGLERAVQDLSLASNWGAILAGFSQSSLIDTGSRLLPSGAVADLATMTAALQDDTDATYGADPNKPVWRVYGYAPVQALLPASMISTRAYVVVWVADDPADGDGDPSIDANRVLLLHAEAYGENGARKAVDAAVQGTSSSSGDKGYFGQRGQDEQNRRSRKSAVQTPGLGLTSSHLDTSTGQIQ